MVLLLYLIVFERTSTGQFTTSELLLGMGATLGIAAQAAFLIPSCAPAVITTGPALTSGTPAWARRSPGQMDPWIRPGAQAALVVVSKLASSATVGGRGAGLAAPTRTRCGSCRTR